MSAGRFVPCMLFSEVGSGLKMEQIGHRMTWRKAINYVTYELFGVTTDDVNDW